MALRSTGRVLVLTCHNLAYVYPTSVATMNYNSVILVGVIALTTIWWFIHGARKYPGPALSSMYIDGVAPMSE